MLGRIRREAENITINRTGILGVQSISTQYESVARPLDSLGITEIQYAPQGAQTASLQLNTLLTHTLEEGYSSQMSLDVMQNLTGNIPFSGIIDYGAEKIYFSEGYLETYSVSCGIGEVPQTSTNSIIFGDFGTGNWSQLSETRRHLPVVAVEIVPRRTFSGYQLGGGQWIYQDVLFHILAENSLDRNQLVDLVSLQNDKTIWIPHYGLIQESSKFPLSLDFRGSPRPSAIMYPDLVADTADQDLDKPKGGFRHRKVYMSNTIVQEMGEVNPHLFGAVVRTTFQIVEGAI